MLEIAEFVISVLILVAVVFEAVISYKAFKIRQAELEVRCGFRPDR